MCFTFFLKKDKDRFIYHHNKLNTLGYDTKKNTLGLIDTKFIKKRKFRI